MSFFRTNNVTTYTNGQSGTATNAWGVLVASGSTGTLTLQPTTLGGATATTINIAHLAPGVPFPCYIRNVSVTTGTVYVLA